MAVCSWKTCTPWKGPTLEQFVKNLYEGLTYISSWRTVSHVMEQGKSVQSPPPKEEGGADSV